MSRGKFAPITSNLLARKGAAGPSLGGTKPSLAWHDWRDVPEPQPASPPRIPAPPARLTGFVADYVRAVERQAAEAADHDPLRKIIIRLSREEYERLGIAAVKKGLTRNQLIRAAIDAYAEVLLQEYGNSCACIAGSCERRCDG